MADLLQDTRGQERGIQDIALAADTDRPRGNLPATSAEAGTDVTVSARLSDAWGM